MLSLICSWHFSHRGAETGAACLSCHLKLQTFLLGSVPGGCGSPARKCERLQIAGRQKGLAWKAVAQPHLPMALLAQRCRDWGCLLVFPPQTSNVSWEWWWSLPGSFRSPAPKVRTSADSWQPEGAILESCCSASSAHGTACTEAQRLRLLACLATSSFKCSLGMGHVPARLLSQPCSENASICR